MTRAVRQSGLPAPSRLVMLTLADLADNDTGVVPYALGPSLTDLAQMTGLGRSTAVEHLNRLDADGWVTRSQPATADAIQKGFKTAYALTIGGPGTGLVQELDRSTSPGAGPGGVQEPDGSSPAAGHKKSPSRTPSKNPSTSSSELRPDVEEVCTRLADRIEANGSKRPNITARWRTEARLLLDADGRTVEQVRKAIDWCQADTFWRANVLSMPKLREKYDQLRLAATRQNGRASPPGLVEHNGLHLSEKTVADLDLVARAAAREAARQQQQLALEGRTAS